MKNIRIAIVCLLASFLVTSCGNESELNEVQNTKVENLRFNVNVSAKAGFNGETRAYNNKADWKSGDIIYLAIDGNDNNLCKMIYTGDSYWNVEAVDGNTSFANNSGKLSAIFAEVMSKESDGISTNGDVLYTDAGTYTKTGDIVCIDLNMSQRPFSKITVKGIDNGCNLTGKGFNKLLSLSTMKWSDVNEIAPYDYDNNTAVYFGLVGDNGDGTTKIEFVDKSTGIAYVRSYTQTMASGEAIVINGPTSSESDKWNKIVPVTGITLDQSKLNLIIGDEADLTATIAPADASNKNIKWTSSDESVATVTPGTAASTAHVKTLSGGTTTITATTEDGAKIATCAVKAGGIEDFVQTFVGSASVMNFSGLVTAALGLNIKNDCSRAITITNIYLENASTEATINSYKVTDGDMSGNSSRTYEVRANNVYCKSFKIITRYVYNDAPYESTCDFNVN